MSEALSTAVADLVRAEVGTGARVGPMRLLPGGASHEAWSVDVRHGDELLELIVRRSLGGKMFEDALDRRQEFEILRAAHEQGVPVPKPYWYFPELAGKPAFAMARLKGETIGRRIVRDERFAPIREKLAGQMGRALATIHALSPARCDFLPGERNGARVAYEVARMRRELDRLDDPHPAIEMALVWLGQNDPGDDVAWVCHGDFRVGNIVVNETGLVGVLDWEFAHVGNPIADLAFGTIRAWRFGSDALLYGGIAPLKTMLDAYNAQRGVAVTPRQVLYWEVFGNVKWAVATATQARRHLTGAEPSMELASLGRMTAEIELELMSLLDSNHPRR